jgi:hypothetical protein
MGFNHGAFRALNRTAKVTPVATRRRKRIFRSKVWVMTSFEKPG